MNGMKLALALLAAVSISAPALSQALCNGLPCTSTTTDGGPPVSAAQASVLAATAAQVAAAAALPPQCSSAPLPDTIGGTVGTAPACTPRADATRPSMVLPTSGVTASDGTWTVTWPGSGFPSAPTTVNSGVVNPAGTPIFCMVMTKTTTGATGKCFLIVASTLPLIAVSLLGAVVTPYANPAAGLAVMVVGRQ